MAETGSAWIDPEIGESLRGFPDFDFSLDKLPAMRSRDDVRAAVRTRHRAPRADHRT